MSEESRDGGGNWRPVLVNIFSGIAGGLLGLGLAVILNRVQANVDRLWLFAAIGIVFACIMSVVWILSRYYGRRLSKFQKEFLEMVRRLKDRDKLGWVLTTEEMVKEEGKVKAGTEIWVASPNLLEDLPDERGQQDQGGERDQQDQRGGHFCEVVKKNLGKGTKYTYFVPRTEGMKTRVRELRALHEDSDKLTVEFLNEDWFFFMVAGLDVTIHDPLTKMRTGPIMYLGIPNQDGDRGQYQVRANHDFTTAVVDKLEDALNHSKQSA